MYEAVLMNNSIQRTLLIKKGRHFDKLGDELLALTIQTSFVQLTVVYLVTLNVDLWRVTLTQQRVQRCSTGVIQVWFQREG